MTTESAGARLKKIRLEKGWSLEEAHKKTKIHLNILKAMEGDSLTELNPVYLKGFLKIYCNYLGVDPKDYVPDYKEAGGIAKSGSLYARPKDNPERAVSFIKSAGSKFGGILPKIKFKKAFIFALIAVFLVLALFNLGKSISSKRALKPQIAKVSKPAKSAPLTRNEPEEVKTAKAKAVSGIRLGVRSRQNCWLSVKCDGRIAFRGTLEKGRFENWQAKDKIELALANAQAVELEVNGKLFSSLGRKGQRLNIVITERGLDVKR